MAGEIRPDRLRRLVQRLVDIYSPSGKEEEIVDFLHGYLKRHDLPVLRQEVDENRHNLLVLPQAGETRLVLVGHLDTVPAFSLEGYGFVQQGDRIAGLGAADMKGGCAAMVEAYIALWKEHGSGTPAALALVVGEEEEGDGAERLVEEHHFAWALVGEPTDLRPCLSSYGYVEMHLSALGESIHASLSAREKNPVDALLRVLLRMSNHFAVKRPELVYNFRDLFSSQTGFSVPDRCEANLDVHVPPEAPVGEILLELEDLVANPGGKKNGIETTFRFDTIDAGFTLPEKGAFVEALKGIFDRHGLAWLPRSFPSHSDANALWAAGIKPILLGPGRLEEAHIPDECVSFEQVLLAARIYRDVAASMVRDVKVHTSEA